MPSSATGHDRVGVFGVQPSAACAMAFIPLVTDTANRQLQCQTRDRRPRFSAAHADHAGTFRPASVIP